VLLEIVDNAGEKMKLAAPKTPNDYFEATEYAVTNAYDGLAACWQQVLKAQAYESRPTKKEGMLVYSPPTTPEEREALRRSIASYERYAAMAVIVCVRARAFTSAVVQRRGPRRSA
jgi:hypothetical protein